MDLQAIKTELQAKQFTKACSGYAIWLILLLLSIIGNCMIRMQNEHSFIQWLFLLIPALSFPLNMILFSQIEPGEKFTKIATITSVLALTCYILYAVISVYQLQQNGEISYAVDRAYYIDQSNHIVPSICVTLLLFIILFFLASILFLDLGVLKILESHKQELPANYIVKLIFSKKHIFQNTFGNPSHKKYFCLKLFSIILSLCIIFAMYFTATYLNTKNLFDKAYDIWAYEYLGQPLNFKQDLSSFEEFKNHFNNSPTDTITTGAQLHNLIAGTYRTSYDSIINVSKDKIRFVGEEPSLYYISVKNGYFDLLHYMNRFSEKIVKVGSFVVTLDDGYELSFITLVPLMDSLLSTENMRIDLPYGTFAKKTGLYSHTLPYWGFDLSRYKDAEDIYITKGTIESWSYIIILCCLKSYNHYRKIIQVITTLLTISIVIIFSLTKKECN